MSSSHPVFWHEGMFLQAQHFQQHDRYLEGLINEKTTFVQPYAWGFLNLILDQSLLNISKLSIASAVGIFPDGTYFKIPENARLKQVYQIPEGMRDTQLYLTLPLRSQSENRSLKQSSMCRYMTFQEKVYDVIDDELPATDIQLANFSCKIMSEHDDLSAYTYLPLAYVCEAQANFNIVLSDKFIPSYLDIHQSPQLSNFLVEICGLLKHRADHLSARLSTYQQAVVDEFVDFHLLQLMNRYEAIFHRHLERKPLHPECFYQSLIMFLAEIASYVNEERRPRVTVVYQHDNLSITFSSLMQAVRHSLSRVLDRHAISLNFESASSGLWLAEVHDKSLLDSSAFILAISADVPVEQLKKAVINQIKLAPVDAIGELIRRGLTGIPLRELSVLPRQIPFHTYFTYFSVDKQHALWQEMGKSTAIALHVSGDLPELKLALWAIKE